MSSDVKPPPATVCELMTLIRSEATELLQATSVSEMLMEFLDTIGWLEAAAGSLTDQESIEFSDLLLRALKEWNGKNAERGHRPLPLTSKLVTRLGYFYYRKGVSQLMDPLSQLTVAAPHENRRGWG